MLPEVTKSALAEVEMAIDEQGELPIAARARIRRMLLDHGQAWAQAEVAAIRRVLPAWTAFHPATRPLELLELIEAYLGGKAERGTLEQAADALQAIVEELDAHEDPLREQADIVGWGVVRAAWSAMDPGDEAAMDQDPWEWTASFTASMVAAGGPVWDDRGDRDRRRDFWRWWLRDAVPSALAAYPHPPVARAMGVTLSDAD